MKAISLKNVSKKILGQPNKPLKTLLENSSEENKISTMRSWLENKYDFVVTDELAADFLKSYYEGTTTKVCLWDSGKETYYYIKIAEEKRRNDTDSHYLYFIIGKRPTGTKWETIPYPTKEDVYHFNPISHQVNVARQMMREQYNGTYSAYLPVK